MEILHMSGAGNDFAVLDARGKDLNFSALAKLLRFFCNLKKFK